MVELKFLILYNLIMFGITLITTYWNLNSILYVLSKYLLFNMSSARFFFSDLTQILYIYIELSVFISILACIPFHLLSIFIYSIPALLKHEFQAIFKLCIVCIASYVVGFYIIYQFGIPSFLNFFLSFETPNKYFPLHFDAKFDEYFKMILFFSIKINIIFQIPIIMFSLEYWKFVSLSTYIFYRQTAYLWFIFLSAVISPPELLTQFIYISFMAIFYELFIFLKILL